MAERDSRIAVEPSPGIVRAAMRDHLRHAADDGFFRQGSIRTQETRYATHAMAPVDLVTATHDNS